MKLCSTCRDEFADKFSFCPVDGTPLSAIAVHHEEPSITAVPNNGSAALMAEEPEPVADLAVTSSALVQRGEFHLTMMNDVGLLRRLAGELLDVAHQYQLTWPEFKRDPFGFVKRSVLGYGQMVGRVFANRNVMIALGGALLALIVLVAAILLMDRSKSALTSRLALAAFGVMAFTVLIGIFTTWLGKERGAAVIGAPPSDSQNAVAGMAAAFGVFFLLVGGIAIYNFLHNKGVLRAQQTSESELVVEQMLPEKQPTPDKGTAGRAEGSGGGSKKEQDRAHGGGGGGREQLKPASQGKSAIADLVIPPVLAPQVNPPPIRNPALPTLPQIDADKALFPPDPRNIPYGVNKGPTDPSNGPGTGNGQGDGRGQGQGSGNGNGYGPGNDGNTGGGERHGGGGGPGGGGEGGDYTRIFNGKDVTQKARVLSKPEPQYTEDARKNQITGTVTLRVVFTSGGQVTEIHAIKQLPYGLTEKAMAAARMIKFVPAMKDGHPVSMYMQLEYNFNLY